jgi:cobalt/nickel transport system permease protein
MHMADALVSPVVGGTMWATSAALIWASSRHINSHFDERKIPLMGVLGAFVFTAQMINFTIPATGSSGHLGGGLLLAILLGPSAAFLTIASVLMVQALFFADGGLLALGCNIFNLGVFPAFIAYPFIYKRLVGREPRQTRMVIAAVLAAVIALQFGSLGVVLQTVLSGVSALPFDTFVLLMQPVHLAIGVVEGVVTALVVSFVYWSRPEILESVIQEKPLGQMPMRSLLAMFLTATVLIGGVLSWYASNHPDGLEWSIHKVTGSAELEHPGHLGQDVSGALQERTAILPDYALPEGLNQEYPERFGTSLSGIVGGTLTLLVCLLAGVLLRKRTHAKA